MEQINLLLDIVIIILSLWVLQILVGYGGLIGRALTIIGVGIVIFGIAQIIETAMVMWLKFDMASIEMIHRLILILGFAVTLWGYKSIMQKSQ